MENNERGTVELEMPVHKSKIIIKEWLTGRETEYIQEPMVRAGEAKAGVGSVLNAESIVAQSNHRAIEKIVISMDGSSENIVERAMDMHAEDYEFLLTAINEQLKKKATPKEQPSTI